MSEFVLLLWWVQHSIATLALGANLECAAASPALNIDAYAAEVYRPNHAAQL
jgi:hypothetical protein